MSEDKKDGLVQGSNEALPAGDGERVIAALDGLGAAPERNQIIGAVTKLMREVRRETIAASKPEGYPPTTAEYHSRWLDAEAKVETLEAKLAEVKRVMTVADHIKAAVALMRGAKRGEVQASVRIEAGPHGWAELTLPEDRHRPDLRTDYPRVTKETLNQAIETFTDYVLTDEEAEHVLKYLNGPCSAKTKA